MPRPALRLLDIQAEFDDLLIIGYARAVRRNGELLSNNVTSVVYGCGHLASIQISTLRAGSRCKLCSDAAQPGGINATTLSRDFHDAMSPRLLYVMRAPTFTKVGISKGDNRMRVHRLAGLSLVESRLTTKLQAFIVEQATLRRFADDLYRPLDMPDYWSGATECVTTDPHRVASFAMSHPTLDHGAEAIYRSWAAL